MSIPDDLITIRNIKDECADAIINKGGKFPNPDSYKYAFSDFPEAINSIPTSGSIDPDSMIYLTISGTLDLNLGDVVIYPKMWRFDNSTSTGGVRDQVANSTIVPSNIFQNLSGVESLTILDGFTEVQTNAFKNVSNYANITTKFLKLPNTLKKIGYSAFAYNRWPEIIIPDSVEELGERSFEYCPYAKYLEVGEGVTTWGWACFNHMWYMDTNGEQHGIEKVRLKMPAVPSIGQGADDLGGLQLLDDSGIIEVPSALVDAYKTKYPDLAIHFIGY